MTAWCVDGTFSSYPAYLSLTSGTHVANHAARSTSKEQDRMRWIMGPEYNKLMDNMAFRISLNMALFGVWVVAAFALLKLA